MSALEQARKYRDRWDYHTDNVDTLVLRCAELYERAIVEKDNEIAAIKNKLESHAPEGHNVTNDQHLDIIKQAKREMAEKAIELLVECDCGIKERVDDVRFDLIHLQNNTFDEWSTPCVNLKRAIDFIDAKVKEIRAAIKD